MRDFELLQGIEEAYFNKFGEKMQWPTYEEVRQYYLELRKSGKIGKVLLEE